MPYSANFLSQKKKIQLKILNRNHIVSGNLFSFSEGIILSSLHKIPVEILNFISFVGGQQSLIFREVKFHLLALINSHKMLFFKQML